MKVLSVAVAIICGEQDMKTFVDEMLSEQVRVDADSAQFINDLFNNEVLIQYYFGDKKRDNQAR